MSIAAPWIQHVINSDSLSTLYVLEIITVTSAEET